MLHLSYYVVLGCVACVLVGSWAYFRRYQVSRPLLALPLRGGIPLMVVLGPLMGLQYLYWRKRRGQERTTWHYLQEEPMQPR